MWFNIGLAFRKPWGRGSSDSLYYWDEKLSEFKAFSIQVETPWSGYSDDFNVFEICFHWRTKQDHAGPFLHVALLGFEVILNLYDVRHWYEEENRWFKPGEEAQLYGKD